MMTAGAKYFGVTDEQLLHTEAAFLNMQKAFEENIMRIAKNCGRKAVIIFDRGCLDIKAYLPDKIWQSVLQETGDSEPALLESYDAVIHLVTAAKGAEQFYTTQNNTVRTESIDQARVMDDKVMNAWLGHRNHIVIENSATQSFDDKINRVIAAVSNIVGLTAPQTTKKMYMIDDELTMDFSMNRTIDKGVELMITTAFSDDGSKLIMREYRNGCTYSLETSSGDRILSAREYAALEPNFKHTVRKLVQRFTYNDQIYELSTFGDHDFLSFISTYAQSLPPDFISSKLVNPDDYSDYKIATNGVPTN